MLMKSSITRYYDSTKSRHAVVLLTSSLIRTYPGNFPFLLFGHRQREGPVTSKKPLSWLFAQLRIIDIRSSIPSLMEKLETPEYPMISERLTACYEITSALIGFLVQTNVALTEGEGGFQTLPFSVELILQMREDLSNICSLTVEYFRERYDTTTGGFHPASRDLLGECVERGSSPQPTGNAPPMSREPLIGAQLQMLALWLREDDGETVREQAASILKIMLSLYGTNDDFRTPLLTVIEQTLNISGGIDVFRHNHGWEKLMKDLKAVLEYPRTPPSHVIAYGIQIHDIIAPVALQTIETYPEKKEWLDMVRLAIPLDERGSADFLDLKVAVALLAMNLTMTSRRLKIKADVSLLSQLSTVPDRLLRARNRLDKDTRDQLKEAVRDIEALDKMDID